MTDVNFYIFAKRINSTKQPTSETSLLSTIFHCKMREPFNVLHPVLELNTSTDPTALNYAYIQHFGRYYRVKEWSYEGGLWVVSMDVDVLATYKTSIGSHSFYILRSSHKYNGNIRDTFYPITSKVVHGNDTSKQWETDMTNGCFILGVINSDVSNRGGVSYYRFTPAQLRDFNYYLLKDPNWLEITEIEQSLVKALFNPFEYITSCVWLPFTAPVSSTQQFMELGWWRLENINCGQLHWDGVVSRTIKLTVRKHPQANTRGNYLNAAPYAKYTLQALPWGVYELDSAILANYSSIILLITTDCATGEAHITVRPDVGATDPAPAPLVESTVQFGVPVQLSALNNRLPQQISGLVGSTAGVATSVIGGDVAGIVKNAVSAVVDAIPIAQGTPSTTGVNGSYSTFASQASTLALYSEFSIVADENNSEYGRPLCETAIISDIPGYILCGNADYSGIGTAEENDAVNELLNSGFFYE